MSEELGERLHIQVNTILYNAPALLKHIKRERKKYPSAKYVVLHLVGGREQRFPIDDAAKELGVEAGK